MAVLDDEVAEYLASVQGALQRQQQPQLQDGGGVRGGGRDDDASAPVGATGAAAAVRNFDAECFQGFDDMRFLMSRIVSKKASRLVLCALYRRSLKLYKVSPRTRRGVLLADVPLTAGMQTVVRAANKNAFRLQLEQGPAFAASASSASLTTSGGGGGRSGSPSSANVSSSLLGLDFMAATPTDCAAWVEVLQMCILNVARDDERRARTEARQAARRERHHAKALARQHKHAQQAGGSPGGGLGGQFQYPYSQNASPFDFQASGANGFRGTDRFLFSRGVGGGSSDDDDNDDDDDDDDEDDDDHNDDGDDDGNGGADDRFPGDGSAPHNDGEGRAETIADGPLQQLPRYHRHHDHITQQQQQPPHHHDNPAVTLALRGVPGVSTFVQATCNGLLGAVDFFAARAAAGDLDREPADANLCRAFPDDDIYGRTLREVFESLGMCV